MRAPRLHLHFAEPSTGGGSTGTGENPPPEKTALPTDTTSATTGGHSGGTSDNPPPTS